MKCERCARADGTLIKPDREWLCEGCCRLVYGSVKAAIGRMIRLNGQFSQVVKKRR
jgi:hypothetical protein